MTRTTRWIELLVNNNMMSWDEQNSLLSTTHCPRSQNVSHKRAIFLSSTFISHPLCFEETCGWRWRKDTRDSNLYKLYFPLVSICLPGLLSPQPLTGQRKHWTYEASSGSDGGLCFYFLLFTLWRNRARSLVWFQLSLSFYCVLLSFSIALITAHFVCTVEGFMFYCCNVYEQRWVTHCRVDGYLIFF